MILSSEFAKYVLGIALVSCGLHTQPPSDTFSRFRLISYTCCLEHENKLISVTGFNRLLHPDHKHVSRFHCLERNFILDVDDPNKRACQLCHLLRVSHEPLENTKATYLARRE